MREKNWIFDLDDTLRWTSWDYTWANASAYKLLCEELQHRVPYRIADFHEEIDHALAKKRGLNPARYVDSLEETYRAICHRAGVRPDDAFIPKIRACAEAIFDKRRYATHGLVDGAAETLEFLLSHGDTLTLITRGAPDEQTDKVKATGLDKYFGDGIIVVHENPPDKSPHFKRVLGNKDPSTFYSVGDSIDSDVNLATKLKMWGIHIPNKSGTWRYDKANRVEDDRVLLARKHIDRLDSIDRSMLPRNQARKLASFINSFRKLDAAHEVKPGKKAYAQRVKGVAWFPARTIVLDRISDIRTHYGHLEDFTMARNTS